MKIVVLTGHTSSSVFGGQLPPPDDDDPTYLHGPEWRTYLADADVIVAIWGPSKEPIICRAPEGVTIQALNGAIVGTAREPQAFDSITEAEFRARMEEE